MRLDVLPPPEVDAIYFWTATVRRPGPSYRDLLGLLSADEQARAAGMRNRVDRVHFVVARAELRTILASYIGGRPNEVRFRYGQHGKPELAEPRGTDLTFSLSHSGAAAICAVGRRRVGVDLQQVRTALDWQALARRFFSSADVEAIEALPKSRRRRAFFTCWVMKEAVTKACGRGLTLPLDSFSVPEVGRLEGSAWVVRPIQVPQQGYVAAIAAEAS